MTRETLTDRLVSYADAVAAFAVVNSLAFLLALTETEVRCSLAHLLWLVATGQIVVGLAMTGAVVALRRVELRLRAPDAPIAVDLQRLLRNLYLVRITVIWLSVAAIVPVVRMALSDPVCSTRAAWRGPGASSVKTTTSHERFALLRFADRRGGPPRTEAGTLAAFLLSSPSSPIRGQPFPVPGHWEIGPTLAGNNRPPVLDAPHDPEFG